MGKGKELLKFWESDRKKFHKFNMGYDLLQEFYDGLHWCHLIPFLKSDEDDRKTALAILSELECNDEELVEVMIPFLKSGIDIERFYSAEWFQMFSKSGRSEYFIYVIDLLNDSSPEIVKQIASMVFNASNEELQGAMGNMGNYISYNFDTHKEGLELLLSPLNNYSEFIDNMLNEKDHLLQLYYAIYCVRFVKNDHSLLDILIRNSENNLTVSVAEFGRKLTL